MYSYGVGWAGKDGKYKSIKTPAMQTVMKWATDIYKDGLQPADTLTWTGSGQQRELHRQEHRADLQRPQHHLRHGERGGQGHRRQGEEDAGGGARQSRGPAAPGRARTARRMWAIAMSMGVFKNSKDPEAAMSLIAHLALARGDGDHHEGLLRPVRAGARQGARGLQGLLQQERQLPERSGARPSGSSPTGWPGPVTAAAAEVQASNVLTDAPAKVIVDKWSRGSGHRVGGQEDQGNLRHPARVTRRRRERSPWRAPAPRRRRRAPPAESRPRHRRSSSCSRSSSWSAG